MNGNVCFPFYWRKGSPPARAAGWARCGEPGFLGIVPAVARGPVTPM